MIVNTHESVYLHTAAVMEEVPSVGWDVVLTLNLSINQAATEVDFITCLI